MKLYHGSKSIVMHPMKGGSKPDNDYGPAFYLTQDIEAAHEWACRNNTVGVVNEYDLATRGLRVLNLTDKTKYSVLNWLAVLLHFRTLDTGFRKSFQTRLAFIEDHYYIDVAQYDLVVGYRADDAYFRFPLDFIRGNITLEQLEYSFELGKLGTQYVIVSKKSMMHLAFKKSMTSKPEYISRYFSNVQRASKAFDDLDKDEEGTRIIDIMRGMR